MMLPVRYCHMYLFFNMMSVWLNILFVSLSSPLPSSVPKYAKFYFLKVHLYDQLYFLKKKSYTSYTFSAK